MKRLFLFLLLPQLLDAQSYISYFTGDTSDVSPVHYPGVCMMGGATEDDNAMRWFLQRAGGGDVLVIRASGADGYNDYLFSELGVPVNSVETIVTPDLTAALDPYVAQQIRRAEALWMAGGDQTDYVNFWKDNAVEDALRYLIHEKKVVIGGTSAGMAILGEAYFRAANGTVTSAQALANPFDPLVDIGRSDFLDHPMLRELITDTHYDNPNRRGRHLAFLARLTQETGNLYRGIACEEYTAVCIDTNGIAHVYGDPAAQDFAYFLQVGCSEPFLPEICVAGQPLHWVRDSMAVVACRMKGLADGSNTFDLNDWHTQTGGIWQDWWAQNGSLKVTTSSVPFQGCFTGVKTPLAAEIAVYPNPASGLIQVEIPCCQETRLQLFDGMGRICREMTAPQSENLIEIERPERGGLYWLIVHSGHSTMVKQLVWE